MEWLRREQTRSGSWHLTLQEKSSKNPMQVPYHIKERNNTENKQQGSK
jgi:hypothetical protein